MQNAGPLFEGIFIWYNVARMAWQWIKEQEII